jgi:hypothetical protein
MNGKQSTWFRILSSVASAFLFGLLVYVTLMALPAAATNQSPNWSNGWTPLDFDYLRTPTAITLVSFEAIAGMAEVQLTWETASEIDNAGFNIWRSEVEDGPYTQLNTGLIPAQGDADTGASYVYTDTTVAEGVTYYYKLEDVDIYGTSTFHGPVSATLPHTIFLPIVLKPCPCQSTRPPLHGTVNFAGEVEILTPPDCTTGIRAETRILVPGTYTGTLPSVTLWVLAYAPNDLYYPQSPNACEGEPPYQEGGDWQVPVYLGEKGGDPECFDIVVILTDQEASQFLSDWVQQGCQAGQYEGILAATLNKKAITEKSYITVQTRD